MLDEQQIRELVVAHGATVNEGRPIKQLIDDGDIPRLNGSTVLEGKVSDVKRELGLIRLTWHRVRKHARAILLAGATVAGLLWARAAGVGLRWIH